MPFFRRIRTLLPSIALIALAVVAIAPAGAHAATYQVGTTYFDFYKCGGVRGSGGLDNAGNMYLPCFFSPTGAREPNIRVYDANDRFVKSIPIPVLTAGQDRYAADVAPSPDGTYLYVSEYQTGKFFRLVRQANGTYARDNAWALQKFAYGGLRTPRGQYLATDGLGNLYISNGTWVEGEPALVLKYDQNGRLLTTFGEYRKTWDRGYFYWILAGIAVSRDGSTVYTAENGNSRVQRWDANGVGSYTSMRAYGSSEASDPNRWGGCGRTDQMAAPYDLATDMDDNLYVINTSCGSVNLTEVHRINGDQHDIIRGIKYGDDRQHAIAVSARGTLYIPCVNAVLTAAPGAVRKPAPDLVAPVLTAVTVPNTTATREIALRVTATDAVGVTHMRVLEGDGDIATAAWRAYALDSTFTLEPGDGQHRIRVQVRDAAGNVSAVRDAYTVLAAPVDVTAPVIQFFTAPVRSTVAIVPVDLTATDAGGVTQMRIVQGNADITAAPWVAYNRLGNQIALAGGNGEKILRAQVRDAAGNVSAVATTAVLLDVPPAPVNDVTAPTLTQVAVPNPTPRQAKLAITATDNVAVTEMRLATEAGVWGAWQPFNAAPTFVLTAGAGVRGVFVQVRDAKGLESGALYRTTVSTGLNEGENPNPDPNPNPNPDPNPGGPDTAPTLRNVTLPAQTTTRDVVVTIDAIDDKGLTEMRMATEAGVWGAWKPFAAAPTFQLTAGVGVRGVFVQVRDVRGQESGSLYRTTRLDPNVVPNPDPNPNPNPNPGPNPGPADTVRPTVRAITLPAQSTTRLITVGIDAVDNVGVTHMRLANEDGAWGAWQAYAPTTQWVLTRVAMTKGVFVQVRDAAGNESAVNAGTYRTMLCAAPCSDPPAGALRAFGKAKATGLLTGRRAVLVRLIRGSLRADRLRGTRTNDHFDSSAKDGKRDIVECGAGTRDTVLKRPEDITRGCEIVRVVRDPR